MGTGLGWNFPRECLGLCSRSCLVTAQFVLPKVGGEGSRCNVSLLVPGPSGAGNLRFSHLIPGKGSYLILGKSLFEPCEQYLSVRNLGLEQNICGKEIMENWVLWVLFPRGLLKCFTQSSSGHWRRASSSGPFQEPLCSSASAENSWALPLGSPLPTIIDLSPSLSIFLSHIPSCFHSVLFPSLKRFPYMFISSLKDVPEELWWLSGLLRRSGPLA